MANRLNLPTDVGSCSSSDIQLEDLNSNSSSLECVIEFDFISCFEESLPISKRRRKARSSSSALLSLDSKTRHSLGESCRRKLFEELFGKLVSTLPRPLVTGKKHQSQQLKTVITYFACLESLLHQTGQGSTAQGCPILRSLFGTSFSTVLGLRLDTADNRDEDIVIESLVANVASKVAESLDAQAKSLLWDWCQKNNTAYTEEFLRGASELLEGTEEFVNDLEDL